MRACAPSGHRGSACAVRVTDFDFRDDDAVCVCDVEKTYMNKWDQLAKPIQVSHKSPLDTKHSNMNASSASCSDA